MIGIIAFSLLVIAIVLFVPVGVLFVECVAALLPTRADRILEELPQPKLAVLVPAHDEAAGIGATLTILLPQLVEGDRLVVIADNCTDATAEIAREVGATVIERQDTNRRGKGYALDYGLRYLEETNPPDVVAIVDADCRVEPGTLGAIARWSLATKRPVQSVYLLESPPQPSPKDTVSSLAFAIKNLVRMRGMTQLGLPCLLAGTGMAFPWQAIRQVSLASGNIVEDMQLSLDLAIAGYPPLFCQYARVTGVLPEAQTAATSQRTRWEHGHLQTIRTQVPRLLGQAWRQRRWDLLAMALDLCVPPLSLLVMLWGAVAIVAAIAGLLTGLWTAGMLLGIEGLLLMTAILGAWARFCRQQIPGKALLSIPLYILWKVPIYLAFLTKPQTKWIRTGREKS